VGGKAWLAMSRPAADRLVALDLLKRGYSRSEVADFLRVPYRTIHRWAHEEFSEMPRARPRKVTGPVHHLRVGHGFTR
jgi:DNA-directed RNA polymerase specialized sigma24 family protein